jgi:CheY-like chemotaxis protein
MLCRECPDSIVQLHGGKVTAHSDGLGKGARFTVELPVAPAREQPPAQPAEVRAQAAASAPKRVLVVDDNRDAAMTLAMMLSQLGHTVKVAHDGLAALEEARGFDADVALVDIGLPVMDGYEVARRLRQLDGSRMRLVAVTGYGQESDRRRAADAGFAAHLVKPVDLPVLLGALG